MKNQTDTVLNALNQADGCLDVNDLSGAAEHLAEAARAAESLRQIKAESAPKEFVDLMNAIHDAHAGAAARDVGKAKRYLDRAQWDTAMLEKALTR